MKRTMSGYLSMLPLVGEAINGICNLGASLVDGIVGPEGLFGRVLDAASSENPFRSPGVAPGERAREMEARIAQLEQMIAERRGMLSEQTALLEAGEKLTKIAEVLEGATLTPDERQMILAQVTAFLSNRDIAEKMGKVPPEHSLLTAELEKLFQQYDLPETERATLLQQIDDILNGVEERTAA